MWRWWQALFATADWAETPDLTRIAELAATPSATATDAASPLPMARRAGGPLKSQPPERWFTLATLRQAWLAVKAAKGGPGVDGVTLQQFEATLARELGALRMELISGVYQPQPVRQVLVPKAEVGVRPLVIWALRDRVAQRAVYELIAPVFETTFLPCSVGFRPGYGVQDALARLEALRDSNLRWVMQGDIQDCFESIKTVRLLKLVSAQVQDRLLRRYIAGWLDAQLLTSADGKPKRAGTSQGSVLSPLLANIYLHTVDQMMMAHKLAYLRYADDFVICCRQKAEAEQARVTMTQALLTVGLQVNPKKSAVVHFDQGFSWLGHFFVRRERYRL